MSEYHVGIDLGGSRIKFIAVTHKGESLLSGTTTSTGGAADTWVEAIRGFLDTWRETHNGPPASIGLCAPGLAAHDAACIDYMPGRMEALQGLKWTRALGSSVPVRVINDAHAALLGEVWRGAARGARNVALFTLGTGVGGALLVDGRLLRGSIGRAGHLGHISLDPAGAPDITRCPGALEDAIGNHNVGERSDGRFHDTEDLIRKIAHDDVARETWTKSVRALGAAIVSIINVTDPEIVILGGGIAAAGSALFAPLNAYLDAHEWRPGGHRATLLTAALGDTAGALGAARFAMTYGEEP